MYLQPVGDKKNYHGWQPNYLRWESNHVEHAWRKTVFNRWIDLDKPQIEFIPSERLVLRGNTGTLVKQMSDKSFKVFIPDIGYKENFLWSEKEGLKWSVMGNIIDAQVIEKEGAVFQDFSERTVSTPAKYFEPKSSG